MLITYNKHYFHWRLLQLQCSSFPFQQYSNAVLWPWPGMAVLSFLCHQVALFWLRTVQMESKTILTVFTLHLWMRLSEVRLQLAAQRHILLLTGTFIKPSVIINYWLGSGYLTRMWRILNAYNGNIFRLHVCIEAQLPVWHQLTARYKKQQNI